MANQTPALAILAGGMSRRMGRPKSSLKVEHQPLLQWLDRKLQWPGDKVLVTAPANCHPMGAEHWSREVIDPVDDSGPLQGIRTALQAAGDGQILFLPLDMLLISQGMLCELAKALENLPEADGLLCSRLVEQRMWIEPFPCILRHRAQDRIEQLWQTGNHSMRGLVQAGICQTYSADHWPLDCWENLNRPEDLARFSQLHFPVE